MPFQIKNRFSGEVMFECELPPEISEQSYSKQLGFVIKQALVARAYLADADLAGANLAGANLAGADLARAYLAGANLAGADLARADLADADLADANLADADLAGANLAGADLAGANLADANLADANLADADLADANLAGADLAGADLAGANLADANLAGADLADANLAGADLARANLAGADLADANLAGADLADAKNVPETNGTESIQEPADRAERQRQRAARFRERNPDVPVVPNLDATILGIVEAGRGELNMGAWHTCETTHCRAGWAVHLAGDAGKALEERFNTQEAGRRIYLASAGRAPWFFSSNEFALKDMREQAELLKDSAA